jgi:hypothetical protein
MLATHIYLVPMSRIGGDKTLLPPTCLHGENRDIFAFTLYLCVCVCVCVSVRVFFTMTKYSKIETELSG